MILEDSRSLEEARDRLIRHLEALEWSYRSDVEKAEPWDYVLLKEAISLFKNLISPKNEKLAGTSSLEHIWRAAVSGESEVSDGFIDEFFHIFKALKLKPDVYPSRLMEGIDLPDFDSYEGRTAALMRSDFLDRMGKRMDRYLARYPSGLDPSVVERRRENKARIMRLLGADEDDWDSWRWQFGHVLKDREDLEIIKELVSLSFEEEKAAFLAVEGRVPFGLTPHYLHLMDPEPGELDYAVRRQVLPPLSYVETMAGYRRGEKQDLDFMRERDTSPVKLVTRRYPKVAIIKPYESCPQICVYCQRNWEITSPFMASAMASPEEIEGAVSWFAEHDQMIDLLLTGGDPLTMSDDTLEDIISRLSEISHLRSMRIASRTPVTVPQRITDELVEIFSSYHEPGNRTLCMVTHISHPYEITPETLEAVTRVRRLGMDVYNQEVFTFANSRRFETAALRVAMKKIGVDPYYTFNMKGKAEMEDYAVPIARILQERKEEARLLPGIFRTDEPVFNVPFLGKDHLRAWQNHEVIAVQPDGRRVYSFLPWEKNVVEVRPYVYTDVSIRSYLEKLRERGEDPEDYRSIWYYY